MMMHKIITGIVLILSSLTLFGQQFSYTSSDVLYSSTPITIDVSKINEIWMPQLQNLEAPAPGGESYQSFLAKLKAEISAKASGAGKTSAAIEPLGDAQDLILGKNFKANNTDGSPNDNDMSISNDGLLISVINSNIIFYNTETDSLLLSIGLADFADTLGLTAHMYDPRTLYDPIEDKFIMVWLSGNLDSTSNIVFAFSETSNPLGNWNLYYLPGNELDGASWTDYPMIAITNDELFLTGNSLMNRPDTLTGSDSWKYLFKESVVWQIDKNSGYAGQALAYKFHANMKYNNEAIRNLCPVRGGSGPKQGEMYLLSNRNFDYENDTIFLLKIEGLYNDLNNNVSIEIYKASQPYGLAPDIAQTNSLELQTNDSRVLSAYTEDGQIHFVGHMRLPEDTARSAIFHGIINLFDNSTTVDARILGELDLNYGYPNIAYSGKYRYDDEAIISFNYASEDSFPGFSAIFYNARTGYSNRYNIKSGEFVMNAGSGANKRWGDYTGSQTKYNEPGVVWANGYYSYKPVVGGGQNATWVAQLTSPDNSDFSSIQTNRGSSDVVKAYPNPTIDRISIEFEVPVKQQITISLYNISGQLVKTFIDDAAKAGLNQFSISTAPLATGSYLLQVSSNTETIATKRIIKQ